MDNDQTREEMRMAVASAALAVTSVVKMKKKAASISCKPIFNIFIVILCCFFVYSNQYTFFFVISLSVLNCIKIYDFLTSSIYKK